jgi:hypothetical protein
MLQQTVESVAHGPDGPADAEVSKLSSSRSPNDYAVTADKGTSLYNRPDARVSMSRRASEFYEVSVAGLDAQKQGLDAAYANPSLSRIRISVTYLKRLIGCVFVRIHWYNSHCAKRWCLSRYC